MFTLAENVESHQFVNHPMDDLCCLRNFRMRRTNLHESISPETVRVARAALDEDNRCRKLREHLDAAYGGQAFNALFPARGQPAATSWRL
jgi:hypothetical protein